MKTDTRKPAGTFRTVEEYYASIPRASRAALNRLRKVIRAVAPAATEVISYQMPTFRLGRMLVSYGAFREHYSFFPLNARLLKKYSREIARYGTSKGTIRFRYDEPLPVQLIRMIVADRVQEVTARDAKGAFGNRTVVSNTRGLLPQGLSKPAHRALASVGITTLKNLARWKESDIRHLHGIGPNAVGVLRKALKSENLRFAVNEP